MKITDVFGHEFDVDCIGCSLVCREIVPVGGIIKETKNFILHQDPEVPIKGFLVIASKQHIKSITDLFEAQAIEFFELLYHARTALLSFEDILECTFIQEERSGHFHFWLFPRYQWMNDLFENSLSSVRAIMKYAEANMKTKENIEGIVACAERLRLSFEG
ncbi:MAG: HIT family hydrolase [Defluviitaleaceae bacterium]|nr:HIT family hydrolase [Defluviitaleaceae bacterium]